MKVLPNGVPQPPVLVFTSTQGDNLALGNLIWMLPLLKALEPFVLVLDNDELKDLLHYNFKCDIYAIKDLPDFKWNTSINNFLCQTTQFTKKIIELRVPCRIGTVEGDDKYGWLFNYPVGICKNAHEGTLNNTLAIEFGVSPKPYTLQLPSTNAKIPKYDILIQAHCGGNPSKDWGRYSELIEPLKKYKIGLIGNDAEREYADKLNADNLCGVYSLVETGHIIKKARLVIGNDSGLLKLSDNLGTPSIQIFKKDSTYIERGWISGENLIEPTVSDVVKLVRRML